MAAPVEATGERRKEKKVQLQCTLHHGAYKILEELAEEDFCKKCDVVRQLIIDERRRRDRMRIDRDALTTLAQEDGYSRGVLKRPWIGSEHLSRDVPDQGVSGDVGPPMVKKTEPALSVTSPEAGEDCYAELGIPVEWERGRIKEHSHIQLLLCTPSGAPVLDTPQTVSNTGQYEWHTTGCASGEYCIMLQTRDGVLLGQSEIFNIRKPPYLKR